MNILLHENIKIDNYYSSPSYAMLYPLNFELGGKGECIHIVTYNNNKYYFRAGGTMKWMYKRDVVSFKYEIIDGRRIINKMSIICLNSKGEIVQRGTRIKPKLSCSKRSNLDGYKGEDYL